MDRLQSAGQFRRALQFFTNSLSDSEAMEIANVFPEWVIGKDYKTNDLITYGTNTVDDPQLYRVLQNHTSQEGWTPDVTPALYRAIGLTPAGYPIWSQPVGAEDAYRIGDIVSYNDVLYICTADYNVYAPGVYGWERYEE